MVQNKPLGYVLLGVAFVCFTAARNLVSTSGGPQVIGIAFAIAGAFAVIAGLNYINGTALLPASNPQSTGKTDGNSPPPIPKDSLPDVGSAVTFEVTETRFSELESTVSFRTAALPPSPAKIELKVQCHGCKQQFTRSECYEFERTQAFSTRRECPHCGSDLKFVLRFSREPDSLCGTICVTGETHMKNQVPSAVGIEILSITAGIALPAAERVLQLIRQGSQAIPPELLNQLDDVNIVDEEGMSLLSLLCHKYTPAEVKAVIQKGADLHHRSPSGVFPLMAAVTGSKVENVRALLDAGVDVNRHANRNGVTALHQAVYATCLFGGDASARRKYAKEIALLLLDAGANPNTRDQGGDTPLSEVKASLEDSDGRLRSRLEAASRSVASGAS